ncbi:MAG: cytochrome c [Acidobacteriota bacterium]
MESINRPVIALLMSLMLVAGLLLLTADQNTGLKQSDLVIVPGAGRDLFVFYCASCHGRGGKGDGRAATALKVPPPDLTALASRNGGTFPAEKVEGFIKGEGRLSTPAHGASDMPVWGPIFQGLDNRDAINEARIETIVKYIALIQAKARA